jgi:hypothetical protein
LKERNSIVVFILKNCVNDKVKVGAIQDAAARFSCNRHTVQRLLRRHEAITSPTNILCEIKSKIKERSGRTGYEYNNLLVQLEGLRFEQRRTLRDTAAALNVSHGVVRRMNEKGLMRKHMNRIHPAITEENKLQRIQFALSLVNAATLIFNNMYDIVHVDEKWFNQTNKR